VGTDMLRASETKKPKNKKPINRNGLFIVFPSTLFSLTAILTTQRQGSEPGNFRATWPFVCVTIFWANMALRRTINYRPPCIVP
jgi:hypothetical protein